MVVSASYCHEYAQEFLNTTGVFAAGESGDFILPYAEIKLELKKKPKGATHIFCAPLKKCCDWKFKLPVEHYEMAALNQPNVLP